MGKESSELEDILLYMAGEILRDIVTARDEGGLLPAAFPIKIEVGDSDFMLKMEIGYKDVFAKYKFMNRDEQIQKLTFRPPDNTREMQAFCNLMEEVDTQYKLSHSPKFRILIDTQFRDYLVLTRSSAGFFTVDDQGKMKWMKDSISTPVAVVLGETGRQPYKLEYLE